MKKEYKVQQTINEVDRLLEKLVENMEHRDIIKYLVEQRLREFWDYGRLEKDQELINDVKNEPSVKEWRQENE